VTIGFASATTVASKAVLHFDSCFLFFHRERLAAGDAEVAVIPAVKLECGLARSRLFSLAIEYGTTRVLGLKENRTLVWCSAGPVFV
jgi:hypothetical protein